MTVADLNLEVAQKFADSLKFPETDAIQLDATDTERLKEVAKDYDLVFNTAGPFSKFAVPILTAVIEAGTNYVDVCYGGNRFDKELREEARGHKDALNPPVDDGSPLWKAPEKWLDKGVWQGQAVIVEGMKDGKKVRYTNRHMCSIEDKGIYTFP